MKQFIRILEEYYATDGILRVYCEKIDPKDIIPEMVENAVRCMESIEEESNGKIHSITLQGLQQYFLIVAHMTEEMDIVVPVKEIVVNNDVEADALLNHVVTTIATSDEPILDLEDIVSRFANRAVANLIPEEK